MSEFIANWKLMQMEAEAAEAEAAAAGQPPASLAEPSPTPRDEAAMAPPAAKPDEWLPTPATPGEQMPPPATPSQPAPAVPAAGEPGFWQKAAQTLGLAAVRSTPYGLATEVAWRAAKGSPLVGAIGAAQGASMDLADEGLSLVSPSAAESLRTTEAQAKEEAPWAYYPAYMLGAALGPGKLKAAGKLGNAAINAGQGFISGAGESNAPDLGGRLEAGVKGAGLNVLGAGVVGAGSKILKTAGGMVARYTDVIRNLLDFVDPRGVEQSVRGPRSGAHAREALARLWDEGLFSKAEKVGVDLERPGLNTAGEGITPTAQDVWYRVSDAGEDVAKAVRSKTEAAQRVLSTAAGGRDQLSAIVGQRMAVAVAEVEQNLQKLARTTPASQFSELRTKADELLDLASRAHTMPLEDLTVFKQRLQRTVSGWGEVLQKMPTVANDLDGVTRVLASAARDSIERGVAQAEAVMGKKLPGADIRRLNGLLGDLIEVDSAIASQVYRGGGEASPSLWGTVGSMALRGRVPLPSGASLGGVTNLWRAGAGATLNPVGATIGPLLPTQRQAGSVLPAFLGSKQGREREDELQARFPYLTGKD